eukprot:3540948-Prymnesium_polylepis.1
MARISRSWWLWADAGALTPVGCAVLEQSCHLPFAALWAASASPAELGGRLVRELCPETCGADD